MSQLDRSIIAALPLFAGMSADDLDRALRYARSVRYPKGTPVFQQGDEAASFFVLLHGHVKASKATPDGGQIVVRYVSPGEIFGVAQATGLSCYPATATAAVDSVALVWPSSFWPELVALHPSVASSLLKTVGQRLQEAHTNVIEMATEAVERRVAHAILRLAKQAGRKIDRGIEIDFPVTRQDIAEMTGTTLYTVSRVLSAWEQQGLVESGRQRIALLDPHKLFALAEGLPR